MRNKIQNYVQKFSIVAVNTDIFVVSEFTTLQFF